MRKISYWLVVSFIIISMVSFLSLTGCKEEVKSTDEVTEAEVEEVAEEEEVAETTEEVVVEEAPVAGEGFEGVNIIFFAGGPPGCPFGSVVAKGAEDAGKDLGCNVDIIYSDWNPEKMISQFKEVVAMKPDGIAIMGHPGQDAFWPLVDDAESKGIIVTSQNTDLPEIEVKYKANGFGYSGSHLYDAGYLLGNECIKRADLKSGDKAFVWGYLAMEVRGLRTKGVIDALEEEGIVVDYLECTPEIASDPPSGTPVFTGYVSSNPDVKLVVTDFIAGYLETYLKSAGKEPDDIFAAGFDNSELVIEAVRSGYCDLSLDQQPYLQGYLPVLQICLTKTYGFSGLHIDTGSGFIDKDNVEVIAPLVERGIR